MFRSISIFIRHVTHSKYGLLSIKLSLDFELFLNLHLGASIIKTKKIATLRHNLTAA